MNQPPLPFWGISATEMLQQLHTAQDGLTADEAKQRLARYGSNLRTSKKRSDVLALLVGQFKSPIILILLFATGLSLVLRDPVDAFIILAIVVVSGLLGFWQERSATNAVEKLLAIVQIKAAALRDAVPRRAQSRRSSPENVELPQQRECQCCSEPRGRHERLLEVKWTGDGSRIRPIWRMVVQWVANSVPAGTPSRAGKGERKLRPTLLAVNDGRQCCELLQAVGEGRVLRPGEPGEPEAAPGHEAGLAPERPLPPPQQARLSAPAALVFPALAPQPLPTLALGAGLN